MSDGTAIVPAGQPGYDKLHKIKSIGTAFSPTLKELIIFIGTFLLMSV